MGIKMQVECKNKLIKHLKELDNDELYYITLREEVQAFLDGEEVQAIRAENEILQDETEPTFFEDK